MVQVLPKFRRNHSASSNATEAKELNFTESFSCVTNGLAELYKEHVLPLEQKYRFPHFSSPSLTEGDFNAKPMALLVGQYSTGKTTFIKHMLEKSYPGLRTGPEPTTDKFVAVCQSDYVGSEVIGADRSVPAQVLPGNAAVVDSKLPWSQLESFGLPFLSKFEVVHVDSAVFKGVTMIDTPGVLAGNKQSRGYDFDGVIRWFAERVDVILLFFDVNKLDATDEVRRCIQALRGHESKICILLNKADSLPLHELMRVYGALMWVLGKSVSAPEVPRVYFGSFWDKPVLNADSRPLLERDTDALFKLLFSLPARSAARKIDDFAKRARMCRNHAILMSHLRKQMPMIGKTAKHRELMASIDEIYEQVAREWDIPAADFPSPEEYREKLQGFTELHKFPKLEMATIKEMDEKIREGVTRLTRLIPREEVSSVRSEEVGGTPFGDSCILTPLMWFKRMEEAAQPEKADDDKAGAVLLETVDDERGNVEEDTLLCRTTSDRRVDDEEENTALRGKIGGGGVTEKDTSPLWGTIDFDIDSQMSLPAVDEPSNQARTWDVKMVSVDTTDEEHIVRQIDLELDL